MHGVVQCTRIKRCEKQNYVFARALAPTTAYIVCAAFNSIQSKPNQSMLGITYSDYLLPLLMLQQTLYVVF